MTQHRDLKRRIRDRMAKTGESYVTARQHVLAARPEPEPSDPPFDVVEPVDISHHAQALSLACGAIMFPKVAASVEPVAALTRLRDALVVTEDDPEFRLMRRLVLHGDLPPPYRTEVAHWEQVRSFLRRARAGLGGVSPGGRMVALMVSDLPIIFAAAVTRHREPVVYLQATDELVGQRNLIALAAP